MRVDAEGYRILAARLEEGALGRAARRKRRREHDAAYIAAVGHLVMVRSAVSRRHPPCILRCAYDPAERIEQNRRGVGSEGEGAQERLEDEHIGCDKRNPPSSLSSYRAQLNSAFSMTDHAYHSGNASRSGKGFMRRYGMSRPRQGPASDRLLPGDLESGCGLDMVTADGGELKIIVADGSVRDSDADAHIDYGHQILVGGLVDAGPARMGICAQQHEIESCDELGYLLVDDVGLKRDRLGIRVNGADHPGRDLDLRPANV